VTFSSENLNSKT